jgi:hypothetical protein
LEMMLQENLKGAVSQLAEFEEKIAAIPAGKGGRDGRDFDEDFWKGYFQEYIDVHLNSIPPPKDGKDGRDGIDGQAGAPGKDGAKGLSVDLDSLYAVVKDCVSSAVSELPVPPAPVSAVGGYIDRDGDFYLSLSNGQHQKMGRVVGRDGKDLDIGAALTKVSQIAKEYLATFPPPKDGKDGKDGRDGFGFDDLLLEHDGTDFYLVFKRQDEVKRFLLPVTRHIGVWREGEYRIGSQVTYDGSQFIAVVDTSAKPANSPDWQMCVRKGRDGRQGERGFPGKDGKPGRDGRDLTQLAFDGSKS